MSEIQDRIDRTERDGVTFSTSDIIEYSAVSEIKEWAEYLRRKVKAQDERIKELITENAKLRIKLEKCDDNTAKVKVYEKALNQIMKYDNEIETDYSMKSSMKHLARFALRDGAQNET